MRFFETYFGPGHLIVLWCAAPAGWAVVTVGLWRGLTGQARRASLFAHSLTFGGLMMCGVLTGYGLLQTMIVATACWWALVTVTGARPERLIDPVKPGLTRLAVWSSLSAALVFVMQESLL